MLYDCKLNGRLSSNVDGHVDNYLLMLCSMPLTIIVRLVFNIKKKPAMGNSSVMDVALCTQKSTFWHQYLERYLCIVIFYDAGC